jgi:TatD DNase family protein
MKRLLDMGIYLGVNGCLLKQENAFEIIRNIPVEKLIIETNSPGCGIPNP